MYAIKLLRDIELKNKVSILGIVFRIFESVHPISQMDVLYRNANFKEDSSKGFHILFWSLL